MIRKRVLIGAAAAVATASVLVATAPYAFAEPKTTTEAAAGSDIADLLKKVPGMTVVAEEPAPAPYRFFRLTYQQPADHRHPEKGTFTQRMTLLHKDSARPTVLYNSGYNVPEQQFRAEPTKLIDGNQLAVEHRFFTPSRPEPTDWRNLNIWQAATDHHRILAALHSIYPKAWITTGGSKGGMTAVYHRRFYPDDVAGTVAYVAPNDVIDSRDVYDKFLDNVGDDPACRTALEVLQREALVRRAELGTLVAENAAANGLTFDKITGSIDRALEFAVIDTPFAFWQYGDRSGCPTIPGPSAATREIYDFLEAWGSPSFYSDQGIEPYVPYFYQAGTQLGSPYPDEAHLRDLLRYKGQDVPRSLVPRTIAMRFDPVAMPSVDLWVKFAGSRLLFVYGENDPWSAEPFQLGPGSKDSYRYYAPAGNHGSKIESLVPDDAAKATSALLRWAGTSASAASDAADPRSSVLDAYDPVLDRRPPL